MSKRRRRSRTYSKQAERNQICRFAVEEIRAGNCTIRDMSWAVNQACRRAPKNLQILMTRTLNRSCGGRLSGPKTR